MNRGLPHISGWHRQARPSMCLGFSLLELLVTVAIIAILAALLLTTLASAKRRAQRIECLNNLRQVGLALRSYADDHQDRLPDCSSNNPAFFGALWPWDLHTNLVAELEQRGVNRRILYCPSNDMNNDQRWNIWKYAPVPVRVVGYGFLLKGCDEVPPYLWRTSMLAGKPTDTELAFDAIIQQNGDYTIVRGRWVDRSSHLRGRQPAGGNVLCLDGHVEWRGFAAMSHRIYGTATWDF